MERASPYSAFNFEVDFGSGDSAAGFAEVTGLGAEVTVAEYRDGTDTENLVRKVPNMGKVSDVTLKRGIINSSDLWEWIDKTRRHGWPEQREVRITLKDEARNPVGKWTLRAAVPIKYTGPSLNAKGGSDVAVEEFVIACEGITYEHLAA